ncbi:hypothetical protein OIE75_33310 [Streptomyces sp. NBC_01723]|nr:hypothetical protein [Streptomyces sp. NBC_01723]
MSDQRLSRDRQIPAWTCTGGAGWQPLLAELHGALLVLAPDYQ